MTSRFTTTFSFNQIPNVYYETIEYDILFENYQNCTILTKMISHIVFCAINLCVHELTFDDEDRVSF